nr:MAG TPA_asm: hypothetical protein [Caudoviricetes sp.]
MFFTAIWMTKLYLYFGEMNKQKNYIKSGRTTN